MIGGNDHIIYRLNDRDEIFFVNEKWDEFAVANMGENIASAWILQQSLWDFITDPTTRQIYRDMLMRVRAGHSIRFNFRCDSPISRRLMELVIVSGEEGTIEFRTCPLWEENRQPIPLLKNHAVSSDEPMRMCGWCKKVYIDQTWVEVEEAVAHLQLFEHANLPMLTHGICERCLEEGPVHWTQLPEYIAERRPLYKCGSQY
jgi:hypothetical protein